MSELLRVEHLTKIFTSGLIGGYEIRAVDDVSFEVKPGEIVSLVGESGSGKTTVGKLILRLLTPTSGRILFEGEDITTFSKKRLKSDYYRKVQAVFQDPFASSTRSTSLTARFTWFLIRTFRSWTERSGRS